MPTKLARFTSRVVSLVQKAVVGNPKPAVQKGNCGYADWVIVALHGLREYLDHPYRRLLDVLLEMPRISRIIGLSVHELPDFSTVYARTQQLKMLIWRNLLQLLAEFHNTGEIQAIDATGWDRMAASHHYAKRTDCTFTAVKTTALVDCEMSIILDMHCKMSKLGDARIGWQLLKRNISNLSNLTADKGYDWAILRHKLHAEGVKTEIKCSEFDLLDVANNTLINDTTYAQRANVESVFFALGQQFGQQLRARTWFGQFREVVRKASDRNVILSLNVSNT